MGAKDVAVEFNAGLAHFGGEVTLGVKEVVVLVETDANGQTVDFNAGTSGSHHQTVGVGDLFHGLLGNGHFFALSDTPSLILREVGAGEGHGSVSGTGK